MARKATANITKGVTNAAIITAGSLAGRYLGNLDMIPESFRPYVPIAIGIGMQMSKNPMLQSAGQGMIAGGIPPALAALGVEIPNITGSTPPTIGEWENSTQYSLPISVTDSTDYLQALADRAEYNDMGMSDGIGSNTPNTI